MGIKYHQYGCGNDYGDDHYLTDNWNPDYDYGSQYVEVYFNINTPSYMHDKDPSAFGFASDEARDEWYAAASKVIASFDILEDSGYNVENSAEKRAYLYRSLAMKYRLKRLGINDGRNYGSGQTIDHIMRLMQKMSEDGLLVMTSPSGEETYVRSLNKTELKKWIRSHMMLIEQYRFLWSNRKG